MQQSGGIVEMAVRSYWRLNTPDIYLGGSRPMLTRWSLNPGEFYCWFTTKRRTKKRRHPLFLTLKDLLHVGNIKTLETEAPSADFCGRIRQIGIPFLNSPEQCSLGSPTMDSCTQNMGRWDAGRRASRGEGSLTLEAEQANHVSPSPKRPCNFQSTNGGKINMWITFQVLNLIRQGKWGFFKILTWH